MQKKLLSVVLLISLGFTPAYSFWDSKKSATSHVPLWGKPVTHESKEEARAFLTVQATFIKMYYALLLRREKEIQDNVKELVAVVGSHGDSILESVSSHSVDLDNLSDFVSAYNAVNTTLKTMGKDSHTFSSKIREIVIDQKSLLSQIEAALKNRKELEAQIKKLDESQTAEDLISAQENQEQVDPDSELSDENTAETVS